MAARGTLANIFLLSRGFWEVERASGEGGEQRVLLEGRGGGGLKVVVIFGREGQGWGGWGHRRHGRGVGKLGALQEACSGNPPRDVNALSKRGPNPNPNARNYKTLPRPSANTRDRHSSHGGARLSSPAHVT